MLKNGRDGLTDAKDREKRKRKLKGLRERKRRKNGQVIVVIPMKTSPLKDPSPIGPEVGLPFKSVRTTKISCLNTEPADFTPLPDASQGLAFKKGDRLCQS